MLLRIDKAVLDELLADRPALANGIITRARHDGSRERTRPGTDATPA